MRPHSLDIDAGSLLALSVAITELRDNGNRVQTSVLSKSVGNNLDMEMRTKDQA